MTLPILLLLALLETALRVTASGSSALDLAPLDLRLAESARTEVSVVSQPNLMGMVEPDDRPGILNKLKPNRQWLFQGADTRTNSFGFRGAEWARDKPPGVTRVMGIGDSVMFGWGVPLEETYLDVLGRHLNDEAASGLRVEVLNLAVPAYNTGQEVAVFREEGRRFSPDVLVVGYTLNDIAEPAFGPGSRSLVDRSLLARLVRARLQDAGVLHDARGLARVRKGLGSIAELAGARRIPVVFLIYPEVIASFDPAPIRAMAEGLGFHYVDLYAPFDDYYRAHNLSGLADLYVGPDDGHPNAAGHAVIEGALLPAVRAAIEKRREM